MALDPSASYPGQVATGDPGYPYGKAQNVTVSGDGTGTPWEEDLVSDLFGMQQALLDEGGVVPSGVPDEVGASDYMTSMKLATLWYLELMRLMSAVDRGTLASVSGASGIGQHIVLCRSTTSGQIQLSSDLGVTFTPVTIGGTAKHAITRSSTLFVVVGNTGTIYTATATVGAAPSSWTARTADAGYNDDFRGVTWSETLSLFVAVGENGEIQTSPNGVAWTHQVADGSYAGTFNSVADLNGTLIACGTAGEVQTSTDGITWTTSGFAFPSVALVNALAVPGKVIVSSATAGEVWSSIDGIAWTAVATATSLQYHVIGASPTTGVLAVLFGTVAWTLGFVDPSTKKTHVFYPLFAASVPTMFARRAGNYWVITFEDNTVFVTDFCPF